MDTMMLMAEEAVTLQKAEAGTAKCARDSARELTSEVSAAREQLSVSREALTTARRDDC
jgi:hypothetical protein